MIFGFFTWIVGWMVEYLLRMVLKGGVDMVMGEIREIMSIIGRVEFDVFMGYFL